MLIREKLENFDFSPAESIVIDYLLTSPEKIENMTVQKIADETFTQPSTLIRIAKKLEYNGWKDFKKSYFEEWNYLSKNFSKIDANLPFEKTDNVMTISKKIAALEQSTIDDIQSLLRHDNLLQAKQLLLKSECIRIFAHNANSLIAQDFALKMNRIQKNVVVSTTEGEGAYEAYNFPENSCGILISYSGENSSLLKINQIIRERNIPTIAITSIGDNQLSKECSCFLPITTREKLYSKIGNFTINISIIYLLDVLYSLVFSENYDKNLEHLKKVGELVDARKITTDIMKET